MQVAEEAEADFKKAQEKYEESRRIKADFYDAFVSLGNLDFERGKLALGLAIPPPTCAPHVSHSSSLLAQDCWAVMHACPHLAWLGVLVWAAN